MHAAGPVFAARDFDARRLADRKSELGLTASLCIPARDEAATIGRIVEIARTRLMETVPLLDELLVVDDHSTDGTAEVATAAGAKVVHSADVLPAAGPGTGKGDAIWKSLAASSGGLVAWVDGDITDFGPRFVTGLLGPLITSPQIQFVKGFYRRPGGTVAAGGGRVTELVARPLIARLFPHLAGIVQPLSGEYAGRRPVLEALPIVCGWGVDLALVIDVVARHGLPALAQVDLGTRRHRHRPLEELSPQAMAILSTALRRAGIPERDAARLVLFDGDHHGHEVLVEVGERPPLRSLANRGFGGVPRSGYPTGDELTA
ncbi:MAG TPA: glucosyl-3-phosphoglycerate synthase [Acidimicrobiia bacterium]|nr:glucosyl-3-phosphoglycerate synthase [Acidimicrobiia bacterium]